MSTNTNYNSKYNTKNNFLSNNFDKNKISKIEYAEKDKEKKIPSTNLILVLEKEVEQLKKYSENYKKSKNANKSNPNLLYNQNTKLIKNEFEKTENNFLQDKNNYLSLADIQKMKEENSKKLLEIENEFFLLKIKNEKRALNNTLNLPEENINEIIPIEEINQILKVEEENFIKNKIEKNDKNFNKEKNKNLIPKPNSSKKIKRFKNSELEKPLNRQEEKYVKDYVSFMVNKSECEKIKKREYSSYDINKNDNSLNNQENYSSYYISLNTNSPKSLSLKSLSSKKYKNSTTAINSKSKTNRKRNPKKNINKNLKTEDEVDYLNSNDSNYETMSNKNKSIIQENNKISEEKINKLKSHIAFGRVIFQILNKNKTGLVPKSEFLKELDLDLNILIDLGFENYENLAEILISFNTENEDFIEEEEFIVFLISRSDLKKEYLDYYKYKGEIQDLNIENESICDIEVDMQDKIFYSEDEVNIDGEEFVKSKKKIY